MRIEEKSSYKLLLDNKASDEERSAVVEQLSGPEIPWKLFWQNRPQTSPDSSRTSNIKGRKPAKDKKSLRVIIDGPEVHFRKKTSASMNLKKASEEVAFLHCCPRLSNFRVKEKLKVCRAYFYGGFFLLPWLWYWLMSKRACVIFVAGSSMRYGSARKLFIILKFVEVSPFAWSLSRFRCVWASVRLSVFDSCHGTTFAKLSPPPFWCPWDGRASFCDGLSCL